jgi:hypothetical protein
MEKHSSSWIWGVILSVCGVVLSPHSVSAVTFDAPRSASWLIEDRAVAASQLESEATLSSLYRAILLRRSLDETDAASADSSRFLLLLSERLRNPPLSDGDREVVESFFEYVLSDEPWTDTVAWTDTLRRLIAVLRSGNQAELLFRAEVRLAAHLWKQSCPIEGQDGACIIRKDARSLCSAALRAAKPKSYKQRPDDIISIFSDVYYIYQVTPRQPTISASAQRLLSNALHRLPKQSLQTSSGALRDAVMHARFLLLEPEFERVVSSQRWPGAPATINPDLAGSVRWMTRSAAYKRANHWAGTRILQSSPAVSSTRSPFNHPIQLKQYLNYRPILSGPPTRWIVYAQSRMAQLMLDFMSQYYGCGFDVRPLPEPLREMAVRLGFCCQAPEEEEQQAIEQLRSCAGISSAMYVDNQITNFCIEAHDEFWGTDPIAAPEFVAKPNWELVKRPERVSLIE